MPSRTPITMLQRWRSKLARIWARLFGEKEQLRLCGHWPAAHRVVDLPLPTMRQVRRR